MQSVSWYKPVTAKTVKKYCYQIWNSEIKPNITTTLNHHTHSISVTTDMWTSVTMDPYIALTVHYVDTRPEKLSLESAVIAIEPFEGKNEKMEGGGEGEGNGS